MPAAFYQDEWPMRLLREGLSRSDRHLLTEVLVHCTRNLTDGVIDVPLAMLTDHEAPEEGVERLIAAGILDRQGDALVITHEWWRNQRSREQVENYRDENRKRYESYKHRGARHKVGDHRVCTERCPNAGKDLRSDDQKAADEAEGSNAVSADVGNGGLSLSSLSPATKGEREKRDTDSTDSALRRAVSEPVSPEKTANAAYVGAVTGVHVFYDGSFTGTCSICGEPEKAKNRHPVTAPKPLLGLGQHLARNGAAVQIHRDDRSDWSLTAQAPEWRALVNVSIVQDAPILRGLRLYVWTGYAVVTQPDVTGMTSALREFLERELPHVAGGPNDVELCQGPSIGVQFHPYDTHGHDSTAWSQAWKVIGEEWFREALCEKAQPFLTEAAA